MHIPCSQNEVCFFIPLRVHMGLYSHLPHCSGENELSGIQSHQTSWMAIRPSTGVESVIYRVGQWCLMLITAIAVVNKKVLIVIPWCLHTAETMMIITKCELLVFFFSVVQLAGPSIILQPHSETTPGQGNNANNMNINQEKAKVPRRCHVYRPGIWFSRFTSFFFGNVKV